eukprot:COSAG01_NODE_2981_length_6758_cov_11.354408_8_plen_76_part_00
MSKYLIPLSHVASSVACASRSVGRRKPMLMRSSVVLWPPWLAREPDPPAPDVAGVDGTGQQGWMEPVSRGGWNRP